MVAGRQNTENKFGFHVVFKYIYLKLNKSPKPTTLDQRKNAPIDRGKPAGKVI
jgi:hypothetical protein